MGPQVPEGFTVKYQHIRIYDPVIMYGLGQTVARKHERPQPLTVRVEWVINPHGGSTVATIFDAEKKAVATGITRCSTDDVYDKEKGRNRSLSNALHVLPLTRDEKLRLLS